MILQKLSKLFSTNNLEVIGAAWSKGQPKSGTEFGPKAFRDANLLESLAKNLNLKITDRGDIEYPKSRVAKYVKQHDLDLFENVGYLNGELSKTIAKTNQDSTTLILGGDHSLGSGSIHGQLLKHGDDLKVLWIDAHADINTPRTSPSKNYHGMPLAHILGLFEDEKLTGFEWMTKNLNKKNVVLLGIRDVDDGEKKILKDNGIKYFTPYDIEANGGIKATMDKAFEYLELNKPNAKLHVSFDVDGADASVVSATGTPCRFGLIERELIYIMRRIFESGKMVNLDVSEINPLLPDDLPLIRSHGDNPLIETNSLSLYNSIEFIHYAFGKKHA